MVGERRLDREGDAVIRSKPATKESREGWDRVFKKVIADHEEILRRLADTDLEKLGQLKLPLPDPTTPEGGGSIRE